ncbi:MAG: hypothetical protein D6740_12405 [Alphaproteobacteria bacterium]|nr:MAG: hypothetical protein D6740_12405 [Alphaproteobacteria bacterium]
MAVKAWLEGEMAGPASGIALRPHEESISVPAPHLLGKKGNLRRLAGMIRYACRRLPHSFLPAGCWGLVSRRLPR